MEDSDGENRGGPQNVGIALLSVQIRSQEILRDVTHLSALCGFCWKETKNQPPPAVRYQCGSPKKSITELQGECCWTADIK